MNCGCEFDRLTDAAHGEIVVIDTVGCQFKEAIWLIEDLHKWIAQFSDHYEVKQYLAKTEAFLAKVGQ